MHKNLDLPPRKCAVCRKAYKPVRRKQAYCGYACKVRFWKRVRKAGLEALGIKSA